MAGTSGKKPHRAEKKKREKFKKRHPEGRKEWAKYKKDHGLPKYQRV